LKKAGSDNLAAAGSKRPAFAAFRRKKNDFILSCGAYRSAKEQRNRLGFHDPLYVPTFM
jgi:hypothetical protein